MNKLVDRVLEISYKHKLAHIGSCLTALQIIHEIYCFKEEEDIFILSSGHAGLALYVVLEDIYGADAEDLYLRHGVHPHRDEKDRIYCSSGSLGLGLTVAVGFAMAGKEVFCLVSDGECAEGSVWESLNCKEKYRLDNLHIHVNMNGYSAYDPISPNLPNKLRCFCPDIMIHETSNQLPFLKGLDAHYYMMTEEDYLLSKEWNRS